jgi:hypothetical protein
MAEAMIKRFSSTLLPHAVKKKKLEKMNKNRARLMDFFPTFFA